MSDKPVRCVCGGVATAHDYVGGFADDPARVYCTKCSLSVSGGYHKKVAIARWNELQDVLAASPKPWPLLEG